MWEDEYTKKSIKKTVLMILIVLGLVALVYFMMVTWQRTEQEDKELVQAYTQQQEVQTSSRQEAVNQIEQEYQRDLDCLQTYLPGIICWGDSMVSGSSGSVSFPYVLYKYIQANITDLYDFKSSVSYAEDYTYLDWDSYHVDIPVINMGGGNESTYTVLGRAGVDPFVLDRELKIPEDSTPVRIYLRSESNHSVKPLTNGDAGVNNVTIEGIEGVLAIEHNNNWWSSATYTFSRTTPGEETVVDAGTKVVTSGTDAYPNYLHIVCIGTYGQFNSADDLVGQIRSLLARQCSNTDRYLVLGFCSQYSDWADYEYIDTVLQSAFGSHYINVRAYLCSDGITEAGINPSNRDKEYANNGIVPECFRNASGDSQLNASAHKLIGKLVYDRMESLGYFKEVRQELYIDEVVKELIKEDPDYLDNLLENRLKEIGS